MSRRSLLNQEAYGAPGLDGSFQPHLEWYGDFLSEKDVYGPMLPNVRDTLTASSYVDENRSKGLKGLSKTLLGYDQKTYEDTTTFNMTKREWAKNPIGRVVMEWEDEIVEGNLDEGDGTTTLGTVDMIRVQYKMRELSASQVFEYGCDDTVCTAHLAMHFLEVMEIEGTVDTWDEVETYPAYLAAQAFVDGVPFSHESMRAQEKDDDEAYEKAWPVVRQYLMEIGFEGTITPQMIPEADFKLLMTQREIKDEDKILDFLPYKLAGIRKAFEIIVGEEFLHEGQTVKSRTPSKWAKVIAPHHELLADFVDKGNLDGINTLIKQHFKREPILSLDSPKQVAHLLYDRMKLQVLSLTDPTDEDRKFNQPLVKAIYSHRNWMQGKGPALNDIQLGLIRKKAKSDEDAIDYATAFDESVTPEIKVILKAFGVMKKVSTRRKLYYKNYWPIKHWKTGRIHSSLNPCAADTRRYSMSKPNFQQLPKKGEAVRFRAHFPPHKKNAVVCSIDFAGQELRLAADISGDPNMLSCYVGDNLRDIHSITASVAMRLKWGDGVVDMYLDTYGSDLKGMFTEEQQDELEYALFLRLRSGKQTPDKIRKQADDLRKDSKNVNFAAQFGGQALKLAMTLIMRVTDSQLFLDARSIRFPGVDAMATVKQQEAQACGYALTLGGARRHLAASITSPDRRLASRAARQAWNFWIQSSAAEMTKLAMARLWLSGAIYRFDCNFWAPIHDELVSSVVGHEAKLFLRIKHWCMTQPYATMTVPILGSVSLGPNFAKQLECGDYYDADAIDDAVYSVNAAKDLELDVQSTYTVVREGRELAWDRSDAVEFYIEQTAKGNTVQNTLKTMKSMSEAS